MVRLLSIRSCRMGFTEEIIKNVISKSKPLSLSLYLTLRKDGETKTLHALTFSQLGSLLIQKHDMLK